ncbi:MAG: glycoside hydrolase family 3 protein [Faecousia sp.]
MNLREKPFYLSQEKEAWVYATLEDMTEEEKLHQMFCVLGDASTPEQLERLVRENIGGVLFRPVRTAQEIADDFAKLDAIAKFPLLHAANLEEGGAGATSDGTYFANQLQVAASSDPEDVVRFAKCCAVEGQQARINWTFSPVADIDMNFRNPITNCRTYGSDGEQVKRMAAAYVETVQASGMAACAKHFPGDGVDFRDQHLHPTYNSLSAREWRESYGRIYRTMIERGLLSVMVGHICQSAMEAEYTPGMREEDALPASLSRGLLTGVLRGELGFQGLITTDATIMGGYTMAMERAKAIPATFAAGCDMIVFSTDIEEDISYLREGLHSGLVTMERVDEAVTRILALKAKVCVPVQPQSIPAKQWQKDCAERAVTLVKDNRGLLPISSGRFPKIRLALVGSDACWDGSIRELFTDELERRGFQVEQYDPMADDLHGTSRLPKDRLTLTVLHYPHASNQTTVRVNWCPKHALEIPRFVHEESTVFVSLANPYHLQDVPRAQVFVNAYTATRATVAAVTEKLCGESPFLGENPVDPFCGLFDTRL